jgi:hypothetical protein
MSQMANGQAFPEGADRELRVLRIVLDEENFEFVIHEF